MFVGTKLIKGWGVSYKKGKVFQIKTHGSVSCGPILITERKIGNLKESVLVGS